MPAMKEPKVVRGLPGLTLDDLRSWEVRGLGSYDDVELVKLS